MAEDTPSPDDLEALGLVGELDLEVQLRTRGRASDPAVVEYTRDLTEADMAALAAMPRGSTAPSLVKIRSSHHSLARCLASGMRPSQAALVTGYDNSRISILSADPTFQALVADYRAETRSIFADMAERMSNLSLDAIEVLQDRINDAPESFTISSLIDLVKTLADRTGHGPNQDVTLRVANDLIDRPPRESFEEWNARRGRELGSTTEGTVDRINLDELKKLN